ncbi:esterase, SGNH hydrolase-type, subgroup [Pochonia chlamydosporia 170]|uniref:Esterase, SGNH hydrolase-type, subgroup n=1 Tax=Pochonia chlamydosporia 170 TaxID=1380566 RepID=A0A179FSJ1_METCM|nr:esterase, SGNH hydrolase-type, subgroup [Pochonia chlamydosporia 170]OAQ68606.2 esterase, SGNH hydrolase-type, subgroup [Pochonia chlamydosporia 170]
MDKKINTSRFYFEYKGHPIPDITTFFNIIISQRPRQPIIYLAGDSSLDNKYWLPSSSPSGKSLPVAVPDIYRAALGRPFPKADHDEFIRDHIRADDFLIVSVGANDIAMSPNFSTIWHMLLLAWLTPLSSIRSGRAWALRYFVNMFKSKVELYISKLVEKHKPKAVVVCMIYFPLEAQAARQSSWADIPLRVLGYNTWPGRLQAAIAKMYELATKEIEIPGVKIIPFALFEILDGKDGGDYVERVEPSVEGGRKMASQLAGIIGPLIEEEK